jgi:RNA polymerase-binding transcription factor DksA
MVHIIQLGLGVFRSSPSVNNCTGSSEAQEHDQQLIENETTDIEKTQTYQNEGNAEINQVSDMRPELAKIIDNVYNSSYVECLETDLQIGANASCIDNVNTWLSKCVH